MKTRFFALLLAAGLATQLEGGGPLRLSLRDAIARALSDGTAARIAALEVDDARARSLEARSALWPRLDGQVADSNQIINLKTFGFAPPGVPPLVGPFNVFDAHVAAAVNLIDFAARKRYAASLAGVAVSAEERRRTENEVAAAVATLYVAVERGGAKIDEIEANVALFEKLRDLATDQQKAGVATRLDTTRADVQLSRERQALVVARNQRDAARLALLHAIGADLSLDVVLTDSWEASQTPIPGVAESLAVAMKERPELKSIEEQIRAAQLSARAAQAGRWPTLAAEAQGGYNGNSLGDLSWVRSVGAAVNVPIFTGGLVDAQVAEARVKQEELEVRKREVIRQIEEDVRRALLSYQSASSRVAMAGDNVSLAEDELAQARDRFANGVASSIEVDNAQTSLTSAQDSQIDALADEAQARYDLARATGQIRDWMPGH
jgi:outer membrane protein